jgi:DNA polymerase elongation subunit (family B)
MEVFPYHWHHIEEYGATQLRIFGLSLKNESVYIQIDDFLPYIYVELPTGPVWSPTACDIVQRKLKEMSFNSIVKSEPVQRKKLYFAKKIVKDDGYVEQTFPFIKCYFKTQTAIRTFVYKTKSPVMFSGVGKYTLKCHEMDANPLLQFMCMRNIKPASWFTFRGKRVAKEDEQSSFCVHEYNVPFTSISPVDNSGKAPARPLIMSFDIEVNSSNPNVFPDASKPDDKVFQISCVFGRNGDTEEKFDKYILTLCKNKKGEIVDLNMDKLGPGIEVLGYETESALLEGFKDIILEKNPQVICGYNIFSFDIVYMYERSKICNIEKQFCQISYMRGMKCSMKEIKWSSSAYKNQEFKYIDAHGRLWVDLLPIVQRDYKLENYKLKTVSDFFLSATKDPLTPKGIFKCYRMFTPESLAICAKYCTQDSNLVLKLFEKIQTWIGLCEMSNTCNTPIFTLFTQGQQIKIFSQVYKKCMEEGIVIDKDSFVTSETDRFTGAYVFPPVPGLYDMVVSFDFSSLYPSTMIAYNIDYSTLVLDPTIPDEKCHVVEWSDHIGCVHDKTVRKTKVKDIICGDQRHRFMKEPLGVIPTLLKNLLDARKRTNAEMKFIIKEVDEMVDKNTTEYEDKKRMITVLDKRQLSYKVSCNSMYGGYGVKRGYLPFMTGAMCVTAKGRQSIEKASKFLVENYGAKLIYGDSVSGDTPILVRYEDQTVDILRIDEIGEVWKPYEEFKKDDIESNRSEKQQTLPFVSSGAFRLMNILEVWTGEEWSRVRRVIRHKTIKQMYRVLTHTGCVDVTEDHSLLDKNKEKIKPTELSIGSELYHSFPPKEDFLEIEIKDSIIEGKVYECIKCKEHKLEFEFYKDYIKICKECVFTQNHSTPSQRGSPYYISETEYIRNPSNYLCEDLSFVWGMFFAEGSCGSYATKNSWEINNQDVDVLEKCKEILQRCEPLFEWKILDTMESSSVYKLVPKGKVSYIVNKWRRLFYDREGYKKVPYFILNSSDTIKIQFFNGYYEVGCHEGDGDRHTFNRINQYKFDIKGKIGAHGLYTLLHSLGLKIAMNARTDKDNIYTLHTCNSFRKNPDCVKKIITLSKTTPDDFVYDIETESGRFLGGVGRIILKNTDSCYINFPEYSDVSKARDLDLFCRQVENEVSSVFPKPMKFAYEENIYWRYLILTKKRYMALKCDLDGTISNKIEKRGVLLSRRDNSKYIRDTYSSVILKSFYKEKLDIVLHELYNNVMRVCTNSIPIKDLVVTKSIGAIGDYKIRALHVDDKKAKKRLEELEIYNKDVKFDVLRSIITAFGNKEDIDDHAQKNNLEYLTFKEYVKISLPAQIQLAERMRERGSMVSAGERLGYVITQNGDKLSEKMEDTDYFKEHSESLRIDYLYYVKLMINPFDEVLLTVYDQKDIFKKFYKTRETFKKVMTQLENLIRPKCVFLA